VDSGAVALSLAVRTDSVREDRWRVFVELPAESERLPLEIFAPLIDHNEYAFQDGSSGKSVGGIGITFGVE
jgi:hypothetical protein